MRTETVHIPTDDGVADAFVAFPDDDEQHPAVLFYTDIFGIRPVLEARACQLAERGYYVLVPNIFYRHGPTPLVDLPAHIGEDARPAAVERLMPMIKSHTTDRALRDADAYLGFLSTRPEVAAGPIGTIGYCLGGVLALRTAAPHPDRVAAVAGFHPGGLVTDAPDSPHRLIPGISAEVHLGHAEGDMTADALNELDRALDASGVAYTSEVYPGTMHGFTMPDTDAYSEAALQRHWDRLLPLLDRTLG